MPEFPHLPPAAATAFTIAGIVMAVLRLLTASKSFWWLFPEWVQKGLPLALVALGTLPDALEKADNWGQIITAILMAGMTWFAASRGDKRPVEKTPPKVPMAVVLLLCFVIGAVLASCAGAQPSPSCSDDAYKNQLLNCGVAAASCVQKGGTDEECGAVCNKEWADWQERCSQ